MHQHHGPASSPQNAQVEENRILAEVEAIFGEISSELGQKDGAEAREVGQSGRRYSLYVLAVVALVAVLVPAGIKTEGLLVRAVHYAASQ